MALLELAAIAVTVGCLAVLYHRDLRGRYARPPRAPIADRWTFWITAAACIALVPGVLAGVPPWVAAMPSAVAALAVFAIRDRRGLHGSLVPWRLPVLTEGCSSS